MLDARRFASRHRIQSCESGNTHCRPGWIQFNCPLCRSQGGGKHGGFHLGYNLIEGYFHCYRCGSVRFWDVICGLLRVDKNAARRIVGEFQTDKLLLPRKQVTRQRAIAPPPGCGPLLPQHKAYLESRRFDPEALAADHGLLGTGPYSGIWSWRIIIPILNDEERIVAYQGRTIGTAEPRYKMTDDDSCLEDPKGFLYGIHKAAGNTILVVEGAPLVWRLGEGTVGTLGADWKRPQSNRLRQFKNRFILFDEEEAAQARAESLARSLSLFPGNTEILTGLGVEDLDNLSPEKVRKLRRRIGLDTVGAKVLA